MSVFDKLFDRRYTIEPDTEDQEPIVRKDEYRFSEFGIRNVCNVDWSRLYSYSMDRHSNHHNYYSCISTFERDMEYLKGVADTLPSNSEMKDIIIRLTDLVNYINLPLMFDVTTTTEENK